jgi:hypothetical protein
MLGTIIERALHLIGIDSDRVSSWLGRPCGCAERKAKLDSLTLWAYNTIRHPLRPNVKYLNTLLEEHQHGSTNLPQADGLAKHQAT